MFKTPNEFSLHIESLSADLEINHMEAVLQYCEENMLDPADVAHLINKPLKDKLEVVFQELNYLPKTSTLFEG
jgi:hypothetical protein